MTFAPFANGLKNAARVLNIPEDATIGCALIVSHAIGPARVMLDPIPIRYGIIFVLPNMLVRAKSSD